MLVLYLMLKRDFELLEFRICDSPTYRSFCLLGLGESAPKRSSLHSNISRIRPQTLQRLHQVLVEHAVLSGLESGTAVRTDTTPVAALMRPPTDAALLSDAVRVLARLLKKAHKQVPIWVPDHSRRVSYRTTALRSQRREPEEREALYFDLLQDTKRYVEAALFAAQFLEGCQGPKAYLLSLQLRTAAEKALCAVDQTERRVLQHEQVPAEAKTVSLFEMHADILRKREEVVYGHKVVLSFGNPRAHQGQARSASAKAPLTRPRVAPEVGPIRALRQECCSGACARVLALYVRTDTCVRMGRGDDGQPASARASQLTGLARAKAAAPGALCGTGLGQLCPCEGLWAGRGARRLGF